MKLSIIDYGAGNVFSVKSAFERLGISPILTNNEAEIRTSDAVIFPGVGHADAAMRQIKQNQLDAIIPSLTQPVFGICLGMQLMCAQSEEGNVKGLEIFKNVTVKKFNDVPKIPHIGWNNLKNTKGSLKEVKGDVYFVHSYYAPLNKFTIASCEYGSLFTAAMEHQNFLACQFHPEKSGALGSQILKHFLDKVCK